MFRFFIVRSPFYKSFQLACHSTHRPSNGSSVGPTDRPTVLVLVLPPLVLPQCCCDSQSVVEQCVMDKDWKRTIGHFFRCVKLNGSVKVCLDCGKWFVSIYFLPLPLLLVLLLMKWPLNDTVWWWVSPPNRVVCSQKKVLYMSVDFTLANLQVCYFPSRPKGRRITSPIQIIRWNGRIGSGHFLSF